MKKNYFIVPAILLAVLLMLSACGGNSTPGNHGGETQTGGGETTAPSGGAEDVTLSVLVHFDPLILGQEVIDGLTIAADNLGYKVDVERIDPETYKTKIRVALQGNELPDVFYLWGGSYKDPFLEANAILPLEDAIEQYGSAIFSSVIPPRDDGHIYNAPNDALGVYGMFYNKEVLADLGVGPPKDWDELLNLVELCNANEIYAIGIGNNDRWQGDLFYNMMVVSEDAMAFKNAMSGAGSFTDEPFLEAARKVDTLVKMGAFQRGYMMASQNDVVEMFVAGQIATHPIGAWMLPTFAGDFGDISGYTYFPKTGNEDPALAVCDAGSDLGLAVAANSKFPEEAKRYVVEYSIVVNDLKVANGLAPFAETSVQPPADQHQILKDYATMLSKFTKLQTYWFDVVDANSGEPMRDLSHKQFAGEISPEDFVAELEAIMRL